MKILIASGIYPPDIGGPAQYAKKLFETWTAGGNWTYVATYRWERAFPSGVRHFLYFLKILPRVAWADMIIVLDTASVAVPVMFASKLMRKKYMIRTGGDFLWESYVERTNEKVLFRKFYDTSIGKLSSWERLIAKLSGESMRSAQAVVFSTEWQRDIFLKPYRLNNSRTHIVENFYGPLCDRSDIPENTEERVFVAGTRALTWKNTDMLKEAFSDARVEIARRGIDDISLDTGKAIYDSFFEKIRHAYAVVLVSLGDISPNMILDAIRAGTPFIMTKETGLYDRIKDVAIFVDPLDRKDVAEKIAWMADPKNRDEQARKVRQFSFVHSWENIADELIAVWKSSSQHHEKRHERQHESK